MTVTNKTRVPWKGVFTAIVTPFHADGSLDDKGLQTLVKRQVDAGIHGLVPCGTTGESPALTTDEWARVIEITVQTVNGRAWVVAGTGTNNSTASAARTAKAKEIGADGALVITPYYNKPTTDGVVRHFNFIAESVPGFPMMVYNVPGRTALNLTPDGYQRLLEIEEVAALKEASGNLAQVWEAAHRFGKVTPVFSGEDGLNFPIWDVGGNGAVSVLSNVVPSLVVEEFNAFEQSDLGKAYELHNRLADLSRSLFIETSPAPAKYALTRLGLPSGPVRMPLAPLSQPGSVEFIENDLRKLGLL
jgi:4-hydroxy-tetrahydrodipicolinate synthase